MLNILDYYLPDIQLLENESKRFLIWIPDKLYVVLGASNKADDALFVENIKRDNVLVLKRPSGGQTVLLTPNNLIISVAFYNVKSIQPKEVFNQINELIISALEQAGIENLNLSGISDIAILNKKILGSSIYRSKNTLLYHAVLNMGEPATTFEKYLKHPTKEPEYRKGRSHSDFVTSLMESGYSMSYKQLETVINKVFENHVVESNN